MLFGTCDYIQFELELSSARGAPQSTGSTTLARTEIMAVGPVRINCIQGFRDKVHQKGGIVLFFYPSYFNLFITAPRRLDPTRLSNFWTNVI
jgi:hypothetical protein